ncbi:MAG: hypothetical protein B7C24_06385, partial [Bacteroidetes bacterium 4572_77]
MLVYLVFTSITSCAQAKYESNEELQKGAQKLFEKEQYVEAFPLYSQLLSLKPDDANLSYRFGVCLLYSDRSDTYAPISYMKKAIGKIQDPDLYYHLGFAHHVNYYFPAAISYYKEYKTKAGEKTKASFEIDRKIDMCQNGMDMMRSVKDLFVLQKSEVSRNEFFRSYDLKEFNGKIIKKPEGFVNKEDKKQDAQDFIYYNSKAQEIYYSAYSKTNKKQKDIFMRTKLPQGGWSEMQKLGPVINTPYDEDFPVLMDNGQSLYFCSKGHNTIGGYDIFKSVR